MKRSHGRDRSRVDGHPLYPGRDRVEGGWVIARKVKSMEIMKIPEYKPPHFIPVSVDPDDHDRDMFAVPRWVLAVLAEELAAQGQGWRRFDRTSCDGSMVGCLFCDAIRVAREASEYGEVAP